MKKQKKCKDIYEIPWWGEWLNADGLKRQKMVQKLPIVEEMLSLQDLPKKIRKITFAQLLNSLFEDLENASYTKMRNIDKNASKDKS